MSWFKETKPKTGSGTAQPKGTRTTNKIRPVFRTADGKHIDQRKSQK